MIHQSDVKEKSKRGENKISWDLQSEFFSFERNHASMDNSRINRSHICEH